MRKIVAEFLVVLLVLTGCVEAPRVIPPLRKDAESASRDAVAAAQSGRWEHSIDAWRKALMRYQSIDDWAGQGRARLGLAQAYARTGHSDQARLSVEAMVSQLIFPETLRARAAYQLALLSLEDVPAGRHWLAIARSLCGQPCGWLAQFDNLDARFALMRDEYLEAKQFALKALRQAGELPAERAYAHRMLAELALLDRDGELARLHLESALLEDRKLAEPKWLLDDYLLQERLAKEFGDEKMRQESITRRISICYAIPESCLASDAGKP